MATAKKKSTAKTTRKAKPAAQPQLKSFRVAKPTTPFFHFEFTLQTLYWLILSVIVVSLAFWVMSLNMRVQELYDQIDQSSQEIVSPATPRR